MPKKAIKHAPGRWRGEKFYVRMRRRKGESGSLEVPFATRRDADEWYFNMALPVYESGREVKRPAQVDRADLEVPAPKRVRFREGADLWWKFYVRERGRNVTPDTHEAHQRTINAHLKPHFGEMWADEVTDDDVARLRDDLWERGYRKGSARSILTTATMIFGYLRDRGLTPGNPASGILARKPKQALHAVTRFDGMVSLADCENVADLMPRNMRAALWVQRLAGLRVAEVFGLRVGNILLDQRFIQVRSQGGKRIRRRDDDGTIRIVHSIDDLKTGAGRRDVPMGEALRGILIDHIDHFCDGGADPSQHLFTAGAPQNRCSHYNEVLSRASRRCGIVGDTGGGMTSHVLRKSFSTDLSHGNILGLLWSRTMGHAVRAFDGGAEVTADRYTLTPTQERLSEVARLMDRLVEEAGIDASLESAAERDSSEFVTYQTAAALLGVHGSEGVGRLVRAGRLIATTDRPTVERPRRYVSTESVMALREQVASEISTEQVRERFGLSVMQLHCMKASLGIATRPSILNGVVHTWTADHVTLIEQAVAARQERHAQAVPVTEAARMIGMATSTVAVLLRAGILTRLPDMDGVTPGAVVWVSRQSIDDYVERYGVGSLGSSLSSKTYTRTSPEGCLSYAEAAQVLGLSKNSRVAALVSEGKLVSQIAPGHPRRYVTRASVDVLLADRAQKGLLIAAQTPQGYVTLRRAAERMGVTMRALRSNLSAWGLSVENVLVNGQQVEALSVKQVEEVGVRAASRWLARPKYGTEKYRPDDTYLSVAEVAAVLGVAVGTVRSRVRKGTYPGAVMVWGQEREWWFIPRACLAGRFAPTG